MKNYNHRHKILQGKAEHKQRCIRIYIHVERPELHAKRKKKMAPIDKNKKQKKKKEKKVNIGPSCYASSVTKFFITPSLTFIHYCLYDLTKVKRKK